MGASAHAIQLMWDYYDTIMYQIDNLVGIGLDTDNKKDYRHMRKMQRWASQIMMANNRGGEKCDGIPDTDDDEHVYDESDACKLNSQIISSLRSFKRQYACEKVRRRGYKLKQDFDLRKSCKKPKKFFG